jgi:hypothetical protein
MTTEVSQSPRQTAVESEQGMLLFVLALVLSGVAALFLMSLT